jgi:hypothetical protein
MNFRASAVIIGIAAVSLSGCGRDDTPRSGPYKGIAQVGTFARDNKGILLAEALQQTIGTNQPFSMDLQRVMGPTRRICTEALLKDVVENGERLESIFEVVQGGWETKCMLRLKSSEHLIAKLRTGGRDGIWLIAFDVDKTVPLLRTARSDDEGAPESTVAGVVTEGKLTAVEKY